MQQTCIYDIMGLPEEVLKRVLPQAPLPVVTRLITAYPRSIGQAFLCVLAENMSPAGLQFLKDEMHTSQLPSLPQIREAERELLKLVRADELALAEPVLA